MRSQPWKNETTRARLPDSPVQSSPGEEHMDIIAQLKAERDKAAQQVNALDTAIRAMSGLNSTRVSHGPRERRCTSKNLCLTESTLGTSAGPKGCLNRPQASHLGSGSSADSSSKSGEMGKVEAAKLIISGPAHICPHCEGTATFLTGCGF